jgi:creatinine amidohydrolase
MFLADRTWPELGDAIAEQSLAVVPLGSTEQHGPHLPLGTDHFIAEAFAREATDQTGHLCTPPVNVGVSSHHRQFHGTMWLDPPVFRDYVENISRNLTYHGTDRIVYANAHGGNSEHLQEVARRLHEDGTAYAIEWMWNDSIPELVSDLFKNPGPHAGPKETSVIEYIAEELVHTDQLEAARDNGIPITPDGPPRQHGAAVGFDTIEGPENGAFGDATEATPEKGQELFEAATDQLVQLLEWLAAQPDSELEAKSHIDLQPGSHRTDKPNQ